MVVASTHGVMSVFFNMKQSVCLSNIVTFCLSVFDIYLNIWVLFSMNHPTFLYGSENWTITASQRRRIEAAEMKLLRPLAGYTLYDHKTNDYIRCKLQITGILDKIDEYRRNWFQHLQRMPQNRIYVLHIIFLLAGKSYGLRHQHRKQQVWISR